MRAFAALLSARRLAPKPQPSPPTAPQSSGAGHLNAPPGAAARSLRGYIVVKNAISPSQVARLNAILDQKISEGRWHIADRQHQPADAEQAGTNKPGQARPQAGLTQPINCRFGSQARVGELLDWGAELTDLIDQPTVLPILHELCGQGCRLDHVRMRTPPPPPAAAADGTAALPLSSHSSDGAPRTTSTSYKRVRRTTANQLARPLLC